MNAIQKTSPSISGKRVRRFFRQVANLIPMNATCSGSMTTDDAETHVQFMLGNTLVSFYMSEGGAL